MSDGRHGLQWGDGVVWHKARKTWKAKDFCEVLRTFRVGEASAQRTGLVAPCDRSIVTDRPQ